MVDPLEVPQETESKTYLDKMQSQIQKTPGLGTASPLFSAFYAPDPSGPATIRQRAPGTVAGDTEFKPKTTFGDEYFSTKGFTAAPESIKGEVGVEYDEFGLPFLPESFTFGIETKTAVTGPVSGEPILRPHMDIDTLKMSKFTDIEEVYDFSNPAVAGMLNNFNGIVRSDGTKVPWRSDNIQDRIKQMNTEGADALFRTQEGAEDSVRRIPWKKALASRLEMPDDFAERRLRLQPFAGLIPPTTAQRLNGFNSFTVSLANYAEMDQMKIEAVRRLNVAMIEMSETYPEFKSDRVRLGVIDYTLSTDPFGYGKILPEYGRSAAKYTLLAPWGYMFGEGVQSIANTVNVIANSALYGLGIAYAAGKTGPFGGDPVIPYVTDETLPSVFSSARRNEIYDAIVPDYAENYMLRLANGGVGISYPAAQYLARYQMGLLPNVLSQTTEIIMPGGFARKAKSTLSAADFNAFKLYYESEKKKGRTDVDSAEFLEEFINENKASLVSRGMLAFSQNKIVNGFLFNKPYGWGRVGLVNRINAGRTMDEIATKSPEFRTPYLEVQARKTKTQSQIDALNAAIEASENGVPTTSQATRLKKLEDRIEMENNEALAILAKGDVDPLYHEMIGTENYMVLAAAAGNGFAEAIGGDPALGEGIGALASVGLRGARNIPTAIQWVRKLNKDVESKKIDQIEEFAMALNTADPVQAEALITKARYIIDLQNSAIDEGGVDPSLVKTSVAMLIGVAGIHGLEPSIRQVKPGDLRRMSPKVFELIDLHKEESLLLTQMRGAFSQLSQGDYPAGSAAAELQEHLQESIKFLEASLEQRSLDFEKIMTNAGAKFNEMIMDGTEKAFTMTDLQRGELSTFEEAYNALLELNIGLADLRIEGPYGASSPLSTVVEVISEIRDGAMTRVHSRTNQALSDIANPGSDGSTIDDALAATGEGVAEILPESGAKVKGRNVKVEPADVVRFDSGDKLHQLTAEVKRGADEELAAAPFRILDRKQYFYENGTPVGTEPYVNGALILDDMIGAISIETGVPLSDMASGNSLSRSLSSNVMRDLNYTSRTWFATMLEEGMDLDEVIADTVQNAKNDPSFSAQFESLKMFSGQADAVIAAMYQRHVGLAEGVDIPTIKLSYSQLRRVDSLITEMQQRASRLGRDKAASEYSSINKRINGDELARTPSMYDMFVIDDADELPVPVNTLYVYNENGDLMSIADTVTSAKRGWMDHKAIWYDDSNMKNWMGWGKRDAAIEDPDYPLGIQVDAKWFDWNKVGTEGYDIAGKFKSWRRAMGDRHSGPNSPKEVMVGTPAGDQAVSSLRLSIAEWLLESAEEGVLSFAEQDEVLLKIQKTFVGIDSNGNKVPLFPDIGSIVDDVREYGTETVPIKIRQEAEKAVANALSRQRTEWKSIQSSYEKDMNAVISALQSYTGRSVPPGSLFAEVTKGGAQSVEEFRRILRETPGKDGRRFTDDELDVIMADLAIQAIEDSVFSPTGIMQVNPRDPTTMIPTYDMNMNVMSEILGLSGDNQRAVAAAVEKSLGSARYKTAVRMFNFMSERTNSPLGGAALSGVPRSFSIESYISRFYAINRDVIGPQYVGTESLIQRFRIRGFSLMQAALTDPEIGELFIDMLESGKPLPPDREKILFEKLALVYVKFTDTLTREDPLTQEMLRGQQGITMLENFPSVDDPRMFPHYQGRLGGEFYFP